MADEAGKAWQGIVRTLSEELPGEWVVGRPGVNAILVREPIAWTLCWVGLDRPRRTAQPYLIAGVVDLIRPFSLGYQHGLRSSNVDSPGTVDLLQPTAAEVTRDFAIEHATAAFDRWTPEALAAEAEQKFAQPSVERGRPILYPSAAGWRVVLDSGSPVSPASEAAEEFAAMGAPEEANWYRGLIGQWEAGGRPGALRYLEDHRRAVLSSLKLV